VLSTVGHDERQEQQGAGDRLELEVLIHHQRHPEPAEGFQHGRGAGELDRVADRLPEDRIVRERDEVAEADEGGRPRHLSTKEAQVHAVKERVAQEQQEEEDRRA
jgi:hypothetical protein